VLAGDLARFSPAGGPRLAELRDDEVLDRALLPMLNEAARALEEEVVAGPRELDLATVFGMGFPPFHGGLLRYADSVGLHAIAEKLSRIAARPTCSRGARAPSASGPRTPSPRWRRRCGASTDSRMDPDARGGRFRRDVLWNVRRDRRPRRERRRAERGHRAGLRGRGPRRVQTR
jgi:hypothetical protein